MSRKLMHNIGGSLSFLWTVIKYSTLSLSGGRMGRMGGVARWRKENPDWLTPNYTQISSWMHNKSLSAITFGKPFIVTHCNYPDVKIGLVKDAICVPEILAIRSYCKLFYYDILVSLFVHSWKFFSSTLTLNFTFRIKIQEMTWRDG